MTLPDVPHFLIINCISCSCQHKHLWQAVYVWLLRAQAKAATFNSPADRPQDLFMTFRRPPAVNHRLQQCMATVGNNHRSTSPYTSHHSSGSCSTGQTSMAAADLDKTALDQCHCCRHICTVIASAAATTPLVSQVLCGTLWYTGSVLGLVLD